MVDEQRFHAIYRLWQSPEGVTEQQLRDDKVNWQGENVGKSVGAADAFIITSIILPPDGSYSQVVYSADGRTGQKLPPAELWKAWAVMAAQLAKNEDLSSAKRELCQVVWDSVVAAMESIRSRS